jgi:hypothetical protein
VRAPVAAGRLPRSKEADVAEEQSRGGPTVRRMLLGAQLRRLRIDAGLSREEAAEAITERREPT